ARSGLRSQHSATRLFGECGCCERSASAVREAVLDARRRAGRVELAHELADRHPAEGVLCRVSELVEDVGDDIALPVLGTNVRKCMMASADMLHDLLDTDAIGIASGNESGPLASDLLHQLHVLEFSQ